ncbi:MAG: glycosyltransferase [Lacisediminihabitans sp.]
MTESRPRVLVVSHNPFSDLQNNGKTLSVFFEGWPKDRLAQFYLTLDDPSFSTCERFFRTTDLDVLRKAVGLRPTASGVVSPTAAARDTLKKESLHRNPLYLLVRSIFLARLPVALLVRSLFWKMERWYTPEFEAWLDDFDPEVVFFQSSSATFAFDIVEQICKRRNIPLVMETTDDYVTAPRCFGPFTRLHYRRMRRVYGRAVRRATGVIAIGGKMAKEYSARFGGRWSVAMNAVAPGDGHERTTNTEGKIVLHYAGNLGLNRWRVLHSIGQALELLHCTAGVDACLEIFSIVTPDPKVLQALTIPGRVEFKGRLDGGALRERQMVADVLVHVESFDAKSRHITRLSVSTKIPEYLASGGVLLAVGPLDVASIEYLSESGAAHVVTSDSPEVIAGGIEVLVSDHARQEQYLERARGLVERNHSKDRIRTMVTGVVTAAAAS